MENPTNMDDLGFSPLFLGWHPYVQWGKSHNKQKKTLWELSLLSNLGNLKSSWSPGMRKLQGVTFSIHPYYATQVLEPLLWLQS